MESWNMSGTIQLLQASCHPESQIPIQTHQRKGVGPTGLVCIARRYNPNHRLAYRTWKCLAASSSGGQAMENRIAPASKLIGLDLHPLCKEIGSATRSSSCYGYAKKSGWATVCLCITCSKEFIKMRPELQGADYLKSHFILSFFSYQAYAPQA